ncbi:fasciclin domain-containing protein [Nostoc sp. CHAB 5784]|uniref:fasciclin domain-containing protein n=1 Tax=Nostoc mirabile TaxID=2907820 RepID=UPI001E503F34|nr:fasciclin domain-containing protein [Nostoc mirabile]MCC5664016.1 fasciclin domain-containing protein [Nostoc mirabile CHAB5784]
MANTTDTGVTSSSFSTLVDAIKAANLIDTLKGVDSFIASPSTNQAFAKLPADTVETLLNNINKLQELLTYHIVSGKVMPIKPIEGSSFKIDPFYRFNANYEPQPQNPMLLMITVSSTSLLIPQSTNV